jgi:hypothetical protein
MATELFPPAAILHFKSGYSIELLDCVSVQLFSTDRPAHSMLSVPEVDAKSLSFRTAGAAKLARLTDTDHVRVGNLFGDNAKLFEKVLAEHHGDRNIARVASTSD